MADKKEDQGTNPPPEKPLLDKRAMVEKSLVGYNRAPESDSSSDSSDDEDEKFLSEEDAKKKTLQKLQRNAFYSLIRAFSLETSTMSNKRNEIIEKLKNEWQISNETHISFEDKIQKTLLTLQQKDEKEMQMVPDTPLTKPATPSSTCVPKAGKSWGSVDPESLIGKWFRMRVTDEGEFVEFIIKEYDAKQEIHRLETADSNEMEVDDQYSWIDLRDISSDDIMWEGGEKSNFGAPNKSAATAPRALS